MAEHVVVNSASVTLYLPNSNSMAGEQTHGGRDAMKTLVAAVAFATVFAAPVFAQSVNAWGWKSALAAPASAKSAYGAAPFDGRRGALSGRRGAL